MGPQKFLPLGVYQGSTLVPNFSPLGKKMGSRGAGDVFIFFQTATCNTWGWHRACTRANYCLYFILQGTKFAKKLSNRILNFFPILEIWPPKHYQIFCNFFFQNSRRPGVKETRAKLDLCTQFSWEISPNSTFGHNLGVGWGVEGLWPPECTHGQNVILAIFGQFPWPNRTSWVNS